MFQFIHTADIHLDSPLRGLERYEGAPAEEIRLATRRAFENVVNLAIERQVAFVLIAGDLFDGDWKDYNTGHYFVRQMARLRVADIQAFIVKGNHDASNKITRSLRLPANVHVFSDLRPETVIIEKHGVAVHGQSFSTNKIVTNLAAQYPDAVANHFNIGVLHTCASGREGHEPYAPCSTADMVSKNYDYWALGHVHKRELLSEDPLVIFPGNLQGRHARETGSKGCTLVTVDDKLKATQTFEEMCVLKWEYCKIDVTACDGEDKVFEKITAAINKLVEQNGAMPMAVRAELYGECAADTQLRARYDYYVNQMRAIASDCASDQIWLEKIIFNTTAEKSKVAVTMDGPTAELMQLVADMKEDQNELSALQAQLSALDKKLPGDVKDLMGWTDPDFFNSILVDVQDILLDQLALREK